MPPLSEVISRLHSYSDELTIYAQRPWRPTSQAIVGREADDGSAPPEAGDLPYFLEVDTARECVEVAHPARRVEAVIYYAESDAYLPE